MHKDFAKEYFDIQLKMMESDPSFEVIRKSDTLALVRVKVGNYQPLFRIQADNYDLEPPLIEFADPRTGEKLNDNQWPTGASIANGNSLYPGYIICRTGNRSFHTHPNHLGQLFHLYRNTFCIKAFIDEIVRKISIGQINMSNTGGIYNANTQ